MVRIYIIFLCLFIFQESFSQRYLKGVVLYQNSGGKPAIGVQVTAFGASPESVYTVNNGTFLFKFDNKKPGEKVKLLLGNKDERGENIELVNQKQLELLRMPLNPDDDPIELIVCPQGEKDETALHFYDILVKPTVSEYELKINEILKLLQCNNLSANEMNELNLKLTVIQKERDIALLKVKEQADYIAGINKDQASDLVKKALTNFELNQDIEAALNILDNTIIDEDYKRAIEHKQTWESEINQVIETYTLKTSFLMTEFRYKEALVCCFKVIEIIKTNRSNEEQLADWYSVIASIYLVDGQYDKALNYTHESISRYLKESDINCLDLISTYNKLSNIYTSLFAFDSAFITLNKIYEINKINNDTINLSTAFYYNTLGDIYYKLGVMKAQEDNYKKTVFGPDEHVLMPLAMSLGTYFNKKYGGFENALDAQKRAFKILSQIEEPDSEHFATFYNNLALIYLGLNKYDKALESILQSLSISIETLSPNNPSLATSYMNVGWIYYQMNDLLNAVYYGEKGYLIYHETLRPDHPEKKIAENLLMIYYDSIGDQLFRSEEYTKARLSYQKALAISLENKNVIFSIGKCYYFEKDYLKSIEFIDKSFPLDFEGWSNIMLNTKVGYDILKADQLYYMGISYTKINNFKESEIYLKQLQELAPKVGMTYQAWSIYYFIQKKYKSAILNLQKAVDMGYNDIKWLKTDECLVKIRNKREYNDLLKDMERNKPSDKVKTP